MPAESPPLSRAAEMLSGFHPTLHGTGRRELLVLMDSTNKCNLRCVMCHFSYESTRLEPFDSWDDAALVRLRDQVLPLTWRAVLSVATEPLMWKRFPDLLDVLRQARVPVFDMITNCTLMTDELAERIVGSGMTGVSISVEGGTAATYESIRRPAKFAQFQAGVRRLVAARARHGGGTPRLQFNVVLLRRSIHELPDVMRLAAELGVEDIDLRHVIQMDDLGMDQESMLNDKRRCNAALAEARRLAAELGLRILCDPGDFVVTDDEPEPPPLPSRTQVAVGAPDAPKRDPLAGDDATPAAALPRFPRRKQRPPVRFYATGKGELDLSLVPERVGKVICDAPWKQFNLRPDGTVVPCCFWYTDDRLGDLSTQTFGEIWEGESYRRLRWEVLTGKLGPNCARCPVRGIGDVQDPEAHRAHNREKSGSAVPTGA